ncbi:porin family protein [Arthrospiribacter ruber]|nr:porin family protein [Arthrospiribacter ruber]
MKKLLLLCFVLFGFSALQNVQAQLGLKSGMNLSNFNGYSFQNRLAFRVGAFYGLEAFDNVTIEPGIYFSQKGIKSDAEGISDRLSYIDVPVLFRYGFTERFDVFAGPQASVLATRRYENPDGVSRNTSTIRGYDLAAVLGFGYELLEGVGIEFGYDFGLISLNYFDTNVKSRVFHFALTKTF